MAVRPSAIGKSAPSSGTALGFSEAPAWAPLGDAWRPLHGSVREAGYSVEWHDFQVEQDFDWSRSFHPGGLEICLNVSGNAEVWAGSRSLEFTPFTAGFYAHGQSRLSAVRRGGERHQFLTVELAPSFLQEHILPSESGLHERLESLRGTEPSGPATVSESVRLTSEQQQIVMSLRQPPVSSAAQKLWYQAKVLEIASALLYAPAVEEELSAPRQKRLNQERVRKVIGLLRENLAEPLPLEEIGRRVGCSHFYLSRIFTQEMGKTISACLRDLRMERAATLLREGKLNVTEVAMVVGYSSSSHFSTAFHAAFGCCPGLYPLATATQRRSRPRPSFSG